MNRHFTAIRKKGLSFGRSVEEQFFLVFRSITAGTVHFIRRGFRRNFVEITSRLYKAVSEESIIAVIRGHFEIVRIINSGGGRALTKRYPNYPNKYLTEYLAKSFSMKSRREILKFHHQYLMKHVVETFYETILQTRPMLWSETIDGRKYSISLSYSDIYHSEGDISLIFDMDDSVIYEIAFTIIPGKLVAGTADQALLVGRVQGTRWQTKEIRVARKAFHDVAPPYLLLAAAQAIASALKIDIVGGISDEEQLAKSVFQQKEFHFSYNEFWETFSAKKGPTNIYVIPVPFPEKPLEQIGTSHRRRTKAKRQLRKKIADSVGVTFARDFLVSPSGQ